MGGAIRKGLHGAEREVGLSVRARTLLPLRLPGVRRFRAWPRRRAISHHNGRLRAAYRLRMDNINGYETEVQPNQERSLVSDTPLSFTIDTGADVTTIPEFFTSILAH